MYPRDFPHWKPAEQSSPKNYNLLLLQAKYSIAKSWRSITRPHLRTWLLTLSKSLVWKNLHLWLRVNMLPLKRCGEIFGRFWNVRRWPTVNRYGCTHLTCTGDVLLWFLKRTWGAYAGLFNGRAGDGDVKLDGLKRKRTQLIAAAVLSDAFLTNLKSLD